MTSYEYAAGEVLDERTAGDAPVWYVRDPAGNLLYTLHWWNGELRPDVYVIDHLGSIREILQYDGTVQNRHDYEPYGTIRSQTVTLRNSYTFTGYAQDSTSGQYYAKARYYRADLGRFMSQDTYKGSAWQPWSQNLYVYVGNNPVNYTDPTGHCPGCLALAGGLALADGPLPFGHARAVVVLLGAGAVALYEAAVPNGPTTLTTPAASPSAPMTMTTPGVTQSGPTTMGTPVTTTGQPITMTTPAEVSSSPTVVTATLVWPSTPEEMNELLGFEGTPIATTTPGRNKFVWEPATGITITFELHPFHKSAPTWHSGPHWHLDTPGKPHVRYVPGQPIPDPN